MPGTFFLVDGTALAYRSHFAFINNPLTNAKGQETSATFGYVRALLDILDQDKPAGIVVAFDVSRKTFRKEMYAEYKATREKAPREMKQQFPWIEEITEALGVPVLKAEGFEADDLIGTATRRAEEAGFEVRIISGDKDMMQLVNEHVTMYDPSRRGGGVVIDGAAVEKKFGVGPDRVIDVLALMGDTSDNVPGVPLIGPKKATALITKYGTVEDVLARAPEEEKPSKTRQNLIDFADQARLSKELVTIKTDVDIDIPLAPYDPEGRDHETLRRLFKKLDFNQLLGQVTRVAAKSSETGGYRVVRGGVELDALCADLHASSFFTYATKMSEPDPHRARLLGVAFCMRAGAAAYVPWTEESAEALKPLFEDGEVAKGAQDGKTGMHLLRRRGIEVENFAFDTMLASYLLDPGRGTHTLEGMALRHLNLQKTPAEELVGKGRNQISLAEVEEAKVAHFAAEDADVTFKLVEYFRPMLAERALEKLFREVEMPLVPVLRDMEYAGVRLDTEYLDGIRVEMEELATKLVSEIHEMAGEAFNINSTKQLGPILFEKLQIHEGIRKQPRKTRTGLYSTDATALEPYTGHPIIAKLLEYREVTKLKSTYVDALPLMINPDTGRIHSCFNQAVAATGRLSSDNPNLQNIPVRTELGRRIRRAFVTEPGWKLMSADYSQIELRLMAHLSGDPALRQVYREGGDVHTETASRMFGVPPGMVSRDQRNSAKAINFGILYGMGPMRLARDLKISLQEGKNFIEAYFREFPGVRDFQKQAVETARTEGFVTTLLGRRRAIPEVNSRESGVRAQAENVAKNTPVQGTAADMIKKAMINIWRRMRDGGFESRMILQVHDELVFEGPAAEVEKLSKLVRREMQRALKLEVPIVAEVGVGDNWLEAH